MAREHSDADVRTNITEEIRTAETSSNVQLPRPPSPATVMDPELLGFFRLFTSVGAEIIYGDITFSATCDPLAYIDIPQEVIQEIADRSKVVDDDILTLDPSLGEETSAQPLAMIPPLSSSVVPLRSVFAPQAPEDSQAGDDVESLLMRILSISRNSYL
ncbi:hypothetical protein LIER_12548 [Lithospermum erythrorhizon]|uniref:Uncharacterized protein n=1 Tax=Lithospermum erythrorhizon TaxID=34254 RepID=A0AAV3PTZ3_LITER